MQKICLLIVLIAAAAVNNVFAAETENGVLILTDQNFDEEIAKHEYLLVEFYAPWCGHCKQLTPEYEKAAEILAKNDPPFFLAKVDATEQKKLAEKFAIQGFPTLFFFKKGEKSEYTGGRTSDTIVSWILKKSGPPSQHVTCDALKKTVEDNKFVLAFFGDKADKLYTDAFAPIAEADEKIQYVNLDDAECAAEYKAVFPAVVFFRKFEESPVLYSKAAVKEEVESWLKPLKVPTVFEFTEDEIEAIFGQQQPALILFRGDSDKDAAFMKVFSDTAYETKGQSKYLYSFSGVSGGIQERLAEFMGVTAEHLPTLRAILPANMQKYECPTKPADLTSQLIRQFEVDILMGTLKPHLKSEPVPEKQEGPVTVVVGKSFEDVVLDTSKDVLVKFYAPWCGHCKKLVPIWDELAEAFKAHPSVVIAKFDATVNEAEGVQIKGYPTLTFYPRDNKKGITYEGERDLESLKKWLNENAASLKDEKSATPHDEL